MLRRIAFRGKRSNSENPVPVVDSGVVRWSDGCEEAVVFYGSARHRCPQLGVERAEHLKDSCRASALKQYGSFPRDGAARGSCSGVHLLFFHELQGSAFARYTNALFLKQGTAENRVAP